jgi:zinc protease
LSNLNLCWIKSPTRKLLTSICLVSSLLLSPAQAGLFNPQTFTLANGLQVIVLTNKRAPIVKQILLYKAGSMDEPKGKSGIAHFLEHLMFKGTKNISGKELDKMNEKAGADQNAQTGRDYTLYHQEVVKSDLESVMKLEADRMVNLLIDAKDVEDERPVIVEERRMRTDNEPKGILIEAMMYSFFRNHPYRLPIIGWEHEMEKLSQADAREFYEKWYAPNNAVLILSGDITLEEAKALTEKYYGPIPKRDLPERHILTEPDHRGVIQNVVLRSDRIEEPAYYRMYAAPNQRENMKASYALDVFEQIISEGANSLLYDSLITKQKVASSVSANYSDSLARGPSTFYIAVQPAPDRTLEEARAALIKEINTIVAKGVSKEDVEKAKNRLVADIDYLRDDSFSGSDIFAHAIGTGFNIEDIEQIKERTLAVTVEDVNAAARAIFGQEDYLNAELLPKAETKKADKS